MYETHDAQAYWGVPVYADHVCVKANRVDKRFVDHKGKKVRVVRGCTRGKKDEEKTVKYGLLQWELRRQ